MRYFLTFSVLAILGMSIPVSGALAFDTYSYRKIAREVIKVVHRGTATNIDALIEKNEELIAIGIEGCNEYAQDNPEYAEVMKKVVDNADAMKAMTLEDIEPAWHEGGWLKANGFDINALGHDHPVRTYLDSVLHPATAIIALEDYKQYKYPGLLIQVKKELAEVMHHLDDLEKMRGGKESHEKQYVPEEK